MTIKNKIRGKQNQRTGQMAEEVARVFLEHLGFLHVEPMETGWTLRFRNKKIIGGFAREKTSGDFHAMEPGTSRYTHIEVKNRQSDRLPWSVFKKHQVDKLNAKSIDGAICLVIWVRLPLDVKSIVWPIPGFKPRTSIKWEDIK
jgi:penicillin-binding protein-related factor A (putative recombinase)